MYSQNSQPILSENDNLFKPLAFTNAGESNPFHKYFYPYEVNLLAIDGENDFFYMIPPKKTNECFADEVDLNKYLSDMQSGYSSPDDDFTISEQNFAANDWDTLMECRLADRRLTTRKKTLLTAIAPYIIDECDDSQQIESKRQTRLQFIRDYCRVILRRRFAKAFKRFKDARSKQHNCLAAEAEELCMKELRDKHLDQLKTNGSSEPDPLIQLQRIRRKAIISKYKKYEKHLKFRQLFRQQIYNNVNLDVPSNDALHMDRYQMAPNKSSIILRDSTSTQERDLRNTYSEGTVIRVHNLTTSREETPVASNCNSEAESNISSDLQCEFPTMSPSLRYHATQLPIIKEIQLVLGDRGDISESCKAYSKINATVMPMASKQNQAMRARRLRVVPVCGTTVFQLSSDKPATHKCDTNLVLPGDSPIALIPASTFYTRHQRWAIPDISENAPKRESISALDSKRSQMMSEPDLCLQRSRQLDECSTYVISTSSSDTHIRPVYEDMQNTIDALQKQCNVWTNRIADVFTKSRPRRMAIFQAPHQSDNDASLYTNPEVPANNVESLIQMFLSMSEYQKTDSMVPFKQHTDKRYRLRKRIAKETDCQKNNETNISHKSQSQKTHKEDNSTERSEKINLNKRYFQQQCVPVSLNRKPGSPAQSPRRENINRMNKLKPPPRDSTAQGNNPVIEHYDSAYNCRNSEPPRRMHRTPIGVPENYVIKSRPHRKLKDPTTSNFTSKTLPETLRQNHEDFDAINRESMSSSSGWESKLADAFLSILDELQQHSAQAIEPPEKTRNTIPIPTENTPDVEVFLSLLEGGTRNPFRQTLTPESQAFLNVKQKTKRPVPNQPTQLIKTAESLESMDSCRTTTFYSPDGGLIAVTFRPLKTIMK